MRILAVHDFYQQLGGEDLSYGAECDLLERNGHEVVRYTLHNDAVDSMSPMAAAARSIWNRRVYRELRRLIRHRRPDVMHCTNTFPLISQACYWAAGRERVPVVQALRTYRQLCPASQLYRDGGLCHKCTKLRVKWPAVRHACYRDSRAASAVITAQLAIHRVIDSERWVSVFYAATRFARQSFVDAGYDPNKILVKPNFLHPDPGPGDGGGGYAVFAGRLSPEKGVETMLEAWRRLPGSLPLWIIGKGPLDSRVKEAVAADPRIRRIGFLPPEEVVDMIGGATCLIMPSVWYETFGRSMMEAFARGTPVVASDLGAMAELVDHGRTGLLFPAGNATALAEAVLRITGDPAMAGQMRIAARQDYLRLFTAETNYPLLMDIYRRARGAGVGSAG